MGKLPFSEPDINIHQIKPDFLIVILVQHLSWNPTKKGSYGTCCQWPAAEFVKEKLSEHAVSIKWQLSTEKRQNGYIFLIEYIRMEDTTYLSF